MADPSMSSSDSTPAAAGAAALEIQPRWAALLERLEEASHASPPLGERLSSGWRGVAEPRDAAAVLAGVPHAARPRAWAAMAGAARTRAAFPPGYYEHLVRRTAAHRRDAASRMARGEDEAGAEHEELRAAERAAEKAVVSGEEGNGSAAAAAADTGGGRSGSHAYWSREIAKDIQRTLPGVAFSRAALAAVLNAYAWHNPLLGYTQGMNLTCAALLSAHERAAPGGDHAEDVFWLLAALVEARRGCYSQSMCGCVRDARVMGDLVAFREPLVAQHVERLGVSFPHLCSPWVLCMFLDSPLPVDTALRLWDGFFLAGDQVFFHAVLSVVRAASDRILRAGTPERLLRLMLGGVGRGVDVARLMKDVAAGIAEALAGPHGGSVLAGLREFHQFDVLQEQRRLSAVAVRKLRAHTMLPADELQRLWGHFVEPAPWDILANGALRSVVHFQKALEPALGGDGGGGGGRWRVVNCLMAGVVERLFDVLDSHRSGYLTFLDFVRGVEALTRSSRSDRLRLCFRFFDLDGNGRVDRDELRRAVIMFDRVYHGRRASVEEPDVFCSVVWERAGGADDLGYEAFCEAVALHPLVADFFRLDDMADAADASGRGATPGMAAAGGGRTPAPGARGGGAPSDVGANPVL